VLPSHNVCTDCKLRGTVCVTVADGTPCLGPVTRTGCGAICPSFRRGCYGCFGPMKGANVDALASQLHLFGVSDEAVVRLLRTYYAGAEAFRKASESYERHSS
jgi:sulfhydrogenase subunit delta